MHILLGTHNFSGNGRAGLLLVALALMACSSSSTTPALDANVDLPVVADASDATSVDVGADAGIPLQSGLEVKTTTGPIAGKAQGKLRVYKGIPYAEAPVGDLRLRAPRPTKPWTDTLKANAFGPSCPQPVPTLAGTSEDCLSLNVWAHADTRQRPVMVWIYGGGFIVGETAMPTYDGANLAQDGDVVVISINYRLGLLANLAIPELTAEDPMGATGNMGLLDQIEALRWIKANARAFGGDPENITVFGESAGGISVCALMGAPLADDLFHKGIIESGNCSAFSSVAGGGFLPQSVYAAGEKRMAELGCDKAADRLQCLRALPVEKFVEAIKLMKLFGGILSMDIPIGPTIDGVVLPKDPAERIRSGEAPPRPMIVGSNGNEGQLFTLTDLILTRQDFERELNKVLGDAKLTSDVAALYPFAEFPLAKDAYAACVADVLFNCNTYLTARASQADAFSYHLLIGPLALMTPYGPIHGADIFYVFGNFVSSGVVPTVVDLSISAQVQQAWSSFARTGVPSWQGGWPAVGPQGEFLQIDLLPGVAQTFRKGRCAKLQALGALP